MKYSIIPIQSSLVVIRQSNGSLSAQHDCQLSPRSGAWYHSHSVLMLYIHSCPALLPLFVIVKVYNLGGNPWQTITQYSSVPSDCAWYLFISVHFLLLLTKAFRWDIGAVSSCSFEIWFVNCHFELIQYCQQPGISGRQITSPVFTHPVVSEPCPLCSETNHSSYKEFVRRHGLNSLLNADTWRRYEVICNYF